MRADSTYAGAAEGLRALGEAARAAADAFDYSELERVVMKMVEKDAEPIELSEFYRYLHPGTVPMIATDHHTRMTALARTPLCEVHIRERCAVLRWAVAQADCEWVYSVRGGDPRIRFFGRDKLRIYTVDGSTERATAHEVVRRLKVHLAQEHLRREARE